MLEELAKIVASDPAFATFLSNPAVGEADRAKLLEKVLRNRVPPLIMNFLLVANRKGRLGMFDQIVTAYSALLEQQLGIIEVDAFVAQKLSSEQLDMVRQRVGAALKREVVLHQYIDESIIGGLVLRVVGRACRRRQRQSAAQCHPPATIVGKT